METAFIVLLAIATGAGLGLLGVYIGDRYF
jgi:hypothetical protein